MPDAYTNPGILLDTVDMHIGDVSILYFVMYICICQKNMNELFSVKAVLQVVQKAKTNKQT